MAERTGIEWCDATWNPWVGCDHVSKGCDHCYAHRETTRRGAEFWGVVRRTSTRTWKLPYRLADGQHDPALRRPRRIFVCSFSDFFHRAADPWRDDAWRVIADTPQHEYLLVTKRLHRATFPWANGEPWPNVWVLVSVESPSTFALRAPVLQRANVAVRGLSVEPLLERIAVTPADIAWLDWVIVGGESAPEALCRRMEPEWVVLWRDACAHATVPFFFKQWGGPPHAKGGGEAARIHGHRHTAFPVRARAERSTLL